MELTKAHANEQKKITTKYNDNKNKNARKIKEEQGGSMNNLQLTKRAKNSMTIE